MKKYLVILFSLFCVYGYCQQRLTSEAFAQKIAERLKDSLNLDAKQKAKIFNVNMQLYNLKMQARKEYTGNELAKKIQSIENSRDSLYKAILPEDKYLLYRQNKKVLISNN